MLLLKVLFRNAFRSRLRTALTITGVAVAILAFGLLRTVLNAWYAGVEASSATRLVTRNAVSLVFPLPLSYYDRIRQIDGVKIVSYGTWFGGVYQEEKHFFANFAVEPASYLDLYPELMITPEGREAFLADKRGAVAGKKLMEKFGWKLGDIITLKGTIFRGDWEVALRGVYKGRDENIDETQLFFHWGYLNEKMKKMIASWTDQVGFYLIGVNRPEAAAEVAAAVDSTFKNSLAETHTETEKAFQQGFVAMSGAIVTAIQLVSLVVIAIILAVVANTMVMTTRERTAEFAVLKTLGFRGTHILLLILGESLVITGTGCLLGILATFPAAQAFAKALPTYFPVFHMEAKTVYLDLLAALLVASTAAILPARRAIQISIAEGLRRVG